MARTATNVAPHTSHNGAATPSPVARLSTSPTKRRPTWVLAGVVLVGVAALLGAWVLAGVTDRITVLVAARDLAPGEPLEAGDLRAVEISRTGGLRAVQPSQQDLILGRVARGPIPAGTVVNADLFTGAEGAVPRDHVVVGAALGSGATPTRGLRPGDPVVLLVTAKVTAGQTGAVATTIGEGTVWAVEPEVGPGSSSILVSLLVRAELQEAVAQAASEATLRLALSGAP